MRRYYDGHAKETDIWYRLVDGARVIHSQPGGRNHSCRSCYHSHANHSKKERDTAAEDRASNKKGEGCTLQ